MAELILKLFYLTCNHGIRHSFRQHVAGMFTDICQLSELYRLCGDYVLTDCMFHM